MLKLETKLTKHLQNLINGRETIYDCIYVYTWFCRTNCDDDNELCSYPHISLLRLQEKFEFQARTNVCRCGSQPNDDKLIEHFHHAYKVCLCVMLEGYGALRLKFSA